MKITKHIHSCFLIETGGKRILIDPGSFCYDDKFRPEDWKDIDILLITHGHSDHCFPEAVEIINKNNKPLIIGSKWVKDILLESNIDVETFEPGQEKKIENIKITAIRAMHGEIPKMKQSPREVIGFLVDDGKTSVYHCADTLYMKDKPYADVVLVPITDMCLTMDPKEARIFVEEIKPKLAIPIHFESPKHPVDPNEFIAEMKDSDVKAIVLENRKSIEV